MSDELTPAQDQEKPTDAELLELARRAWATMPLAVKITWQGFNQFYFSEYLERRR